MQVLVLGAILRNFFPIPDLARKFCAPIGSWWRKDHEHDRSPRSMAAP
jgi:hypothetical protein